MNKIIFIDFDGVLNTGDCCRFGPGRSGEDAYKIFSGEKYFNQECVANLNKITNTTGAQLVISSSWRSAFTMDDLAELVAKQGVSGKVVGRTPKLYTFRGLEIKEWLNKHPEVETFVIFDDMDDMESLLPHLIQTEYDDGLEKKHVEAAIKVLS